MAKEIELEKTFLAKTVPSDLKECRHKEIIDMYIPKASRHPVIRLRKNGDKYEMTKKEPVEDDASHQEEHTIVLTEEEFNELLKVDGKKVRKLRYHYPYNGRMAEVDVFQDELLGIIVVDFEFDTIEDKDAFQLPDFCSADITHEEFIAGGMICGKTYEDVAADLERYDYKKLFME